MKNKYKTLLLSGLELSVSLWNNLIKIIQQAKGVYMQDTLVPGYKYTVYQYKQQTKSQRKVIQIGQKLSLSEKIILSQEKIEQWEDILKCLNNDLEAIETEIKMQRQNKKNSKEINSMDPLDQFNIYEVISFDLLNFHFSIINLSYYLIIGFFIFFFMYISSITKSYAIYLNSWSYFIESLYHTVYNIVISQIKSLKGQNYLPLILSLFIFILINNLIGLIPYSFATTSHFILTFSLSFSIVLGATILGFKTHILKFFSLFVPSGCPLGLLPLLVIIETISYLARNISLGLRLGANILSGHMLLSIVSSFILKIMKSGIFSFVFSLLPIVFIIAFCGLECAIAIIQAQVFIVLACSYINDSIKLH